MGYGSIQTIHAVFCSIYNILYTYIVEIYIPENCIHFNSISVPASSINHHRLFTPTTFCLSTFSVFINGVHSMGGIHVARKQKDYKIGQTNERCR